MIRDIYGYLNPARQELNFCGISFEEFYNCAKKYINNILLLKSAYIGQHCYKNFELLCGQNEIEAFIETEDLRFGDFCFADFTDTADLKKLSDSQIAELLYVAHMKQLLHTPFFPALQNNFIYLSHDDAFSLRLFYNQQPAMLDVLCQIVQTAFRQNTEGNTAQIPVALANTLMDLMAQGVIINRSCISSNEKAESLKFYVVGKIADNDFLMNNKTVVLASATAVKTLVYTHPEWRII